MTIFVFANNINTTLAGAISSSATSITLASSSGLPAIPAGQSLVITLCDAATQQNFEVMYATAVTGSTLTVVRAQEGTHALSWLTGAFAYSSPTAGQMNNLMQTPNAIGRFLVPTVYNAAGTFVFTPNAATNKFKIRGSAGGGASGGNQATSASNVALSTGGYSGSYCEAWYTRSSFGATISVVVGAGGVAASAANGGTGGNSTFGSLVTLPGGPGGALGTSTPSSSIPYTTPALSFAPAPTITSALAILLFGSGGFPAQGLIVGGSGVYTGGNAGVNIFSNYPGAGCGNNGVFSGPSTAAKSGNGGFSGFWSIEEYS